MVQAWAHLMAMYAEQGRPLRPTLTRQSSGESYTFITVVDDDMHLAIETKNLVKRYGGVCAVDHVSLRVRKGEIYAFLGLNGAGKTTTIRMLLGLVKPTAGDIAVLGTRIRPGTRQAWTAVGYLVETPHAYAELSVRENVEVLRRLRPGAPPTAVARVLDQVGLTHYANRRAGTLSLGNAQRLGLAKALLHSPELLILDEPSNGLDPAGIVDIRNLLSALAHDYGVTVFLSSHLLGEVTRLADRIGIIHHGRLLQERDVAELERERRRRLVIRTRDDPAALAVLRRAGCSAVIGHDHILTVTNEGAIARPDEIATRLVKAGHAPMLLSIEQEDLEHYFLRLIGMDEGTAP